MADLDRLLEVLRAHPEGLERGELLAILRKQWRHLLREQLENFGLVTPCEWKEAGSSLRNQRVA